MAIVSAKPSPKGRKLKGSYQETLEYTKEYIVRVDDPETSLVDISNVGPGYLDPHEDDPSCVMLDFSVDPIGDSGLLYRVTFIYRPPPVDNEDNGNGGGGGGDGGGPGIPGIMKQPVWSGSSSCVTVPCFEYYESGNNQKRTIVNSAGDPIYGLEREEAEFRLTGKGYYANHTQWMADGRQYTNAVNSDTWNGGSPGTWKCQGCSAQLQVENKGGTTFIFWEVTFEFAYRDDGWNLKPWDVGMHEKCDTNKVPSASGDKRKTIMGQDGKPVRTPVALSDGIALPPGTKPVVIEDGDGVRVYKEYAFGPKFGQVYTPTIGNT